MLGLGVFTLLSGGVAVFSSILVISMANTWLHALGSRNSLKEHLRELAQLRNRDCRGCCRHCCSGSCRGTLDNLRGLAIAAICLGLLELLGYVVGFSALGMALTELKKQDFGGDYVATKLFSCYSGASQYCFLDYSPSFSTYSFSIPCYTGLTSSYCQVYLPDSITSYDRFYYLNEQWAAYSSKILGAGRWLFYAVGNTAIAAPLNIAWGVLTLQLMGLLTATAQPSAASGESTSLLSKGAASAPVFMSGDGRA